MTKVMKCMLYVGIFLVMCLLQGCVLWFPVDVDYDVEIVLSKKRPSLRNDETFDEAIRFGLVNAAQTLQSDQTVRVDLSSEQLKNWRNLS